MRLRYQFEIIQAIRNFFTAEGFMDVLTPPMVENPGIEAHLHPFEVHSIVNKKSTQKYLHTSPEFCMKELLSLEDEKLDNIFTLSYCFRDEPSSNTHRNQFVMLEWYRKKSHYTKIMEDIEQMIAYTLSYLAQKNVPLRPKMKQPLFVRKTVQEIFIEVLNIDILNYLDVQSIKELIQQKFPEIHLPEKNMYWDDYYFLLFLNKVEPELKKYPYILLYEYPAPLAALSTIKPDDTRVCERFEVYLNGLELCNCFNELNNIQEHTERFKREQHIKESEYKYRLNEPDNFFVTLRRGLPKSAGIALGIERLLSSLVDIENPFFD